MSQRWKESLLDVFNESLSSFSSFRFITNSSRFARERVCAWAASLAWSSSIYYTGRKGCFPSSKLTHKHTQTRTNTEAEKHTLHSLAGKLTLSGDEVVGSMVALKESRRMTCWVSRRCAPQAQLCKRGVVRPIFNPPPQYAVLPLTHSVSVDRVSFITPDLSDLSLNTDRVFTLCSSESGAGELHLYELLMNFWESDLGRWAGPADWTQPEFFWHFNKDMTKELKVPFFKFLALWFISQTPLLSHVRTNILSHQIHCTTLEIKKTAYET